MEHGGTSPWATMDSLFHTADLVIGNLEGAVGKVQDSMPSGSSSPVFAIDESKIPLLSKAGFRALSVENNHNGDLGDSGRTATMHALIKSGIAPISFENSPRFFTIKGVNFAIIAINLVPARGSKPQFIPSVELAQKLRLAKNLSNLVIITIHWGSELLDWPNQEQRDVADWLTRNGADLIIGSHPHVVQKAELVNGKPVFFSLGNHLFDQKYMATKEGLIVDCIIDNGRLKCSGITTNTSTHSFYPEISGNLNYNFNPVLLHNPLSFSGITLQGSTTVTTKGKVLIDARNESRMVFQTAPMAIISVDSFRLNDHEKYLFTLESHYSNMDNEVGVRPYVYAVTKTGLIAKWRGSSLAWPLVDATILPQNDSILCALHRGDSFIQLNKNTDDLRVALYKWNGFGFSGVSDKKTCEACVEYYNKVNHSTNLPVHF